MKWATLKQKIGEWRSVLITGPSVAGLLIAMRLAGWLQPFEWAALDQYFRLRGGEPTDPRIVIVAIDESDIERVGQWPISDTVLTKLLEKVKQQQPRAIGLDLYRNLPVQPGYDELVKIYESTPNLIGIQKIVGDANDAAIAPKPKPSLQKAGSSPQSGNVPQTLSGIPPSPVLKKLRQIGSNDVAVDGDGKIRRGLLYLKSPEGKSVASLALRLALIYLDKEGISPKAAKSNPKYMRLSTAVFNRFQPNDGGYVGADAGGYQILLNFRGPAGSFQKVKMMDVLEDRVPFDWGRDRIVFIGPTAPSLNDFFETPYSSSLIGTPERTSGVEVQANLASQILSAALEERPLIQVWPDNWEWLWILLWSCVGAALSWLLRSLLWNVVSLLLVISSMTVGGYVFFLRGWWIPVLPPVLASTVSAMAIIAYLAKKERQDRQVVMNLFGRHVTPEIAEAIWRDRHQILKEGHMLGQRATATVLFTDIQGFSGIAEQIEPEILMSWLNEYMEAMAGLVLENGGVVDKFIGDAVMAVFGVPIPRTTDEAIAQDAAAAVKCALAMASRVRSLNQQWYERGRPLVVMRVGIATGTVVIGTLGSSQREDYTTIGDTVNVAARLESFDKSIEGGVCRILISEQTYLLIQDKFSTRFLGSVLLKGRQQPVKVYQVLVVNR